MDCRISAAKTSAAQSFKTHAKRSWFVMVPNAMTRDDSTHIQNGLPISLGAQRLPDILSLFKGPIRAGEPVCLLMVRKWAGHAEVGEVARVELIAWGC
jgi:hypothetical protein